MLPNFVVIGAGKSGTTSLYHWLRAHPEVFVPASIKDTRFFCYDPSNPSDRVSDWFPIKTIEEYERLFEESRGKKAIGEVTPIYLDHHLAPAQMANVIPDARLVAVLREPVSRVYSHAQMNVRLGLAGDVLAEVRRLASTDEHLYAPKLRRWFEHFPRDRFLFLRFEQLRTEPARAVAAAFGFLGVDETHKVDTSILHNPGGLPRSKRAQRLLDSSALRALRPFAPLAAYEVLARLRRWNAVPAAELPEDVARSLHQRYRPDVMEAQDLLDIDLSSWLVAGDL